MQWLESVVQILLLRRFTYLWFVAIASAASVATVVAYTLPGVEVAYRSPALHVALETAASLISLLLAYLVAQRFRLRARLTSLLLVTAFSILSATNLLFLAIPAALPGISADRFSTWSALVGGFLGAAVLAVAAFAPNVPLTYPQRALTLAVGGATVGLGVVAIVVVTLVIACPSGSIQRLPRPVLRVRREPVAARDATRDHGVVDRGSGRICAARDSARRQPDEVDRRGSIWLRIRGSVTSCFRRCIRTGSSSATSFVWVSTFCFSPAPHSKSTNQRALAQAVLLDERRRLARDLHDGLAQELAFIGLQATTPRSAGKRDVAKTIISAAQRALDESRYAISALTVSLDAPIDETIAEEGVRGCGACRRAGRAGVGV